MNGVLTARQTNRDVRPPRPLLSQLVLYCGFYEQSYEGEGEVAVTLMLSGPTGARVHST